MTTREYGDYLQDILDSINDADEFVRDMTFEQFCKDKKTINAAIRSIEVFN